MNVGSRKRENLVPQPSTLDPKPETPNPKPSTLDPRLSTLNPKPLIRTGISGQIHQAAGPQLVEEISITEGCRTGECRITRAYLMPAKRIIHTVGPRYNEKYR